MPHIKTIDTIDYLIYIIYVKTETSLHSQSKVGYVAMPLMNMFCGVGQLHATTADMTGKPTASSSGLTFYIHFSPNSPTRTSLKLCSFLGKALLAPFRAAIPTGLKQREQKYLCCGTDITPRVIFVYIYGCGHLHLEETSIAILVLVSNKLPAQYTSRHSVTSPVGHGLQSNSL